MAEKNWRYGTEGGIVEFPFFYNLKQEGMMTARGEREKLSIFLSRGGGTSLCRKKQHGTCGEGEWLPMRVVARPCLLREKQESG